MFGRPFFHQQRSFGRANQHAVHSYGGWESAPLRQVRHCSQSMWMRNPVAVANQTIPLRCPRYQRSSVTAHVHPEHSNPRRSLSLRTPPSPLTHPPSSRRSFAFSAVLRRTTRAMANIPGEEIQTQEGGTASGQNDSGERTALDPESDDNVPVEAEELQEALSRPPAVNSSYLPLPWTGRLGYVSCHMSRPL